MNSATQFEFFLFTLEPRLWDGHAHIQVSHAQLNLSGNTLLDTPGICSHGDSKPVNLTGKTGRGITVHKETSLAHPNVIWKVSIFQQK